MFSSARCNAYAWPGPPKPSSLTQKQSKVLRAQAAAPPSTSPPPADASADHSTLVTERGCQYEVGTAFYRAESAQARDLAVLIAAVYRREAGQLKVLDGMCGCGGRALRYLTQADADLVWCNDVDTRTRPTIVANLRRALGNGHEVAHQVPSLRRQTVEMWHSAHHAAGGPSARLWPASSGSATSSGDAAAATALANDAALESRPRSETQGAIDSDWHQDCSRGLESKSDVAQSGTSRSGSSAPQEHAVGGQSDGVAQSESESDADQSPSSIFYPAAHTRRHHGEPHEATQRARVSHYDGALRRDASAERLPRAKRLLTACYLEEDFYDLIDLDMFGSDTTAIGPALDAVRFGGLLYLTSTDGFSSSGKRPQRALAAYGAYTRAHPSANEQGLRMLIGAAVREAAARGLRVRPVFSLFSPHGPVFRAMLRVTRGREDAMQDFGFVGFSHVNGSARTVSFRSLGATRRAAPDGSHADGPLSIAGPLYTGPLHDSTWLQKATTEALSRCWTGASYAADSAVKPTGPNPQRSLEQVLETLLQESDPRLPPWIVTLRSLADFGSLADIPARDTLIDGLRSRGYAACRSHVETRALKTDATFAQIQAVLQDSTA